MILSLAFYAANNAGLNKALGSVYYLFLLHQEKTNRITIQYLAIMFF